MKRILHIVGGMDRAGAETMVMNLYRKIDRKKYQFDFVYFTDKECDYDNEILKLGGRIKRISSHASSNALTRSFELYKIIKSEVPYHAIHCHQLFSNSFHLIAGYFGGVKIRIAHSHNTSDVNSKKWTGRLYQKVARKLIAKFATHFIACGEKAGEFLFPNISNIVLLPNAVDIEKFSAKNKPKNGFRKKNGTDENTTLICQIGRLNPVKNHDFSVEFSKYLKERNFNFQFLIVGDGPLKEHIEQKIKQYDLEDRISMLGVRKDIDQILSSSDLMFMPSFHEGFPVVLVESQTSGTPALISSNISPEVDLGLNLVNFCSLEDNYEKWFNKMIKLSESEKPDDHEIRKVLAARGFDINVSVKRLEEVYDHAN